ncbi:voltage-dependent anion-selective channel protein 2-like isoform X2 [Dendronephthya gigantea]|uniref:voltage-dependent anion-selective channel protein 2-like isoform X2 n=1 Tax=Dendronephthya gigantea TaxID=151771 RepID=UPI00106990DD|nr:voltage-dependent anion-selective channel protein 2-like isoform X2 [Dendronephthya gigantea]
MASKAPPKFDDLGKEARDVFGKEFGYGFFKLDAKTISKKGVDFTTALSSSNETGKVTGNLETKYKNAKHGLTLSEKWTTDNVLSTDITIEDQLVQGLKLSFDTMFAPGTGKKAAKIKADYKRDYFHPTAEVDFDSSGPMVTAASVFGYNGWVCGLHGAFDTGKSKMTNTNIAIGYRSSDFVLHSSVTDASKFAGSVHHKINPKLEAAALMNWATGNESVNFQVGMKYIIDPISSVKVKVNNSSHIGVSYLHKLSPSVKLGLSALVDAKNLDQGGHRVGLSLDVEMEAK